LKEYRFSSGTGTHPLNLALCALSVRKCSESRLAVSSHAKNELFKNQYEPQIFLLRRRIIPAAQANKPTYHEVRIMKESVVKVLA
jgi:hypothetical protein